jgi:hypothetical protein
VPSLLARRLQQRGLPLVWHDLPLRLPGIDVAQRWHRRLDLDQPSTWLRRQMRTAMAGADL